MVRPGLRVFPLPGLGNAALRSFLAAPGPRLRAARDAVSAVARECDVVVVPATTALYRLAPAEYLAGRTFFLKQGDTARRRSAARAARARRLSARHAGRLAGRVQRARRADRSLPDGQRAAVPARPVRRRDREHQDVRRRHAAHALSGARRAPAARRASFRSTRPAARAFAAASARFSKAIRRSRRCTRTSSNGVAPGGIEYYLPLFFDATATLADYLPRDAVVVLHGDVAGADRRFWQDTESRYRCCAATRRGRCCRRPSCSCRPTSSTARSSRSRASRCAPRRSQRRDERRDRRPRTRPLPRVQVDRRADDPLAALKRFLARIRRARADLRRKRGPARDDAAVLRRVRLARCRSSTTSRVRRRRRCHGACSAWRRSHAGFAWPTAKLAFVTEAELYAGRRAPRAGAMPRKRIATSTRWCATSPRCASAIRSSTSSTASAATSASLTLDLGDGDDRVPAARSTPTTRSSTSRSRNLHLIGRYSGASPEAAPLHELGSGQWEKAKKRAAASRRTTRPPSSSTSTRSARRARAMRSRSSRTTTRRSPKASPSRRRPTSRRRSRP